MENTVASAGSKRRRDGGEIYEETHESPFHSPPEAKRIREDLFFDILDDESDPDNTDLYSVMRSLEEELGQAVAASDTDPAEASGSDPDPDPKQPDLGFLLEASDDELGLPPAEAAATTYGALGGVEHRDAGWEAQEVGFAKIWGPDDEIHLDFGFGSGEMVGQDNGWGYGGGGFDGGLFDGYDGGWPADFSDLTWQPDFLPAV